MTITITGTNDNAIINPDTVSTNEDTVLNGNVLDNDIPDPDFNEPLSVTGFTVDANGDGSQQSFVPGDSVILTTSTGGNIGIFVLSSDDGTYTFTPYDDYSGPVPIITYTAGNSSFSDTDTLVITINPLSDAPVVTGNAPTLYMLEDDAAIALGLNAPTVSDAADQNDAGTGDNPELLSLITLTGIPSGVVLDYGASPYTSDGSAITIDLSDGNHITGAVGDITMSTAQFEAMTVLPVAQDATDFTVTVSVTEYEVDDSGVPISGVSGATSTTAVEVDVLAVTDPVDIQINASDVSHNAIVDEDTALDLQALLTTGAFADTDGSENRSIEISNLPVGTIINGTTVTGGTYSISLTGAANDTIPALLLTPPENFSGDITGITISLVAHDTDTDSTHTDSPTTGATTTVNTTIYDTIDSVTLNLYVNPVADDVTLINVSTAEDTSVTFLSSLALTDADGSESITTITINALPTGWVLKDETGTVVLPDSGTTYTIDVTTVVGGLNTVKNYTLTPPAHSSLDIDLNIDVTTEDTQGATTVTDTFSHTQTIAVTSVAEETTGDSDGDTIADLTMNPDHTYTTPGLEDTWYALADNFNTEDGNSLESYWSNQDSDGSEETFAVLVPVLNGGADSANGSMFQYTDSSGTVTTLTYNGTPLEIPMEYLDSVQFQAPLNIAGTFEITMQALTIDTDPDTGVTNESTTGSVTLSSIDIIPVADQATVSIKQAQGGEDSGRNPDGSVNVASALNGIPLDITPFSTDSSETYNVTIDAIPNGSEIYYDGSLLVLVDNGDGTSKVVIENFDATKILNYIPVYNSNVDVELEVSAQSVDVGASSEGALSTALVLPVDIIGVADPVDIVLEDVPVYTEATVDGQNNQVSFEDMIASYTLGDPDGSENATFRITGLNPEFDLAGASYLGGAGIERIWIMTPDQIATAQVTVPQNFSGTVEMTIVAISTENDGNSLTGTPIDLSFTVTPSPEAMINTAITTNEDTLTEVDFAIQYQNADTDGVPTSVWILDTDEVLTSVWILASDVDSNPDFTLYYGNDTSTPLSSSTLTVNVDGYYVLTGADINNIYVQGTDNLSGDFSFGIKYEISDSPLDGTLAAVTTQTDATYDLTINPVTDAVSESFPLIDPITPTDPSDANVSISGTTVTAFGTTSIDVVVEITKDLDANAINNTADTDGSEHLVSLVIDGVPPGVTVVGANYVASSTTGQWLMPMTDPFSSATISQSITFALDGSAAQLADLDDTISIEAITQDSDASEVSSNLSYWTLVTGPDFDGGGASTAVPAAIASWDYTPLATGNLGDPGDEEVSITLNDVIDANINGDSSFSIELRDLPTGTVVTGMLLTVVDGEEVWTASGTGDNVALQTLLDSIAITPPPNFNDNNNASGLTFDAILTTYASSGETESATAAIAQPITPVTDPTEITISAPDGNESDSVDFSIDISNPADGSAGSIVGGNLYLDLDLGSMNPASSGTLNMGGTLLATTPVAGVPGVPDGNYYVIPAVDIGDTLDFSYTPETYASGTVNVTAYVESQETGATNIITTSGSDTFTVVPVSSGFDLSTNDTSGDEDTLIPLNIGGTGLVDTDGSESVLVGLLNNVPVDFLVFYGSDEASAVMASNIGDDGTGNNTWMIPASAAGLLPAYIAIQPPENWSGTVSSLELSVLSGESGQTPTESTASFDMTVNGVADGVTLSPSNSFGNETELITLNLNPIIGDTDGSETATVTLSGAGPGAGFYYSDGTDVNADVIYDIGSDTYTISNLNTSTGQELAILQSSDHSGTITVSAHTVDGISVSPESAPLTFDLDIIPVDPSTGDDTLLYNGVDTLDALDGNDTVLLKYAADLDSLDFSNLSNIEAIDLTANGDHDLSGLSLDDVFTMTDTNNVLAILGDADDNVATVDTTGWTKDTEIDNGTSTSYVYTSNTTADSITLTVDGTVDSTVL